MRTFYKLTPDEIKQVQTKIKAKKAAAKEDELKRLESEIERIKKEKERLKREAEKSASADSQSITSPAVAEKTAETTSESTSKTNDEEVQNTEPEKPKFKFLTKRTMILLGILICLIFSTVIVKRMSYLQDFKIINKNLSGYIGDDSKVIIPDKVETIGAWAFHDCDFVTSVTIPDSVTSIDDYAFSSCDKLTIRCKKGSYAESYAIENDISYENY